MASLFSKKAAKYCANCGKPTVKEDRVECKFCGSTEWVTEKPTEENAVKESAIKEAKMMNEMEGTEEQDDKIVVGDIAEALKALKVLVSETEAKEEKKEDEKGSSKWAFRSVHLGHGVAAGKTVEDCMKAFLLWAQKPADQEAKRFNVSKAMRRMTAFADYGEQHFDTYFSTPCLPTDAELTICGRAFGMAIPKQLLPNGTVAWIFDLKAMDAEKMKGETITNEGIMRYMWMLMLCTVFDPVNQTHGAVIVESLQGCSFSDMMAMNSSFKDVENDLQTMFYGVMPFKMKECILLGCPWWMSFLLRIMRLFMSKKMSSRIHNDSIASMNKRLGVEKLFPWPDNYETRYPIPMRKIEVVDVVDPLLEKARAAAAENKEADAAAAAPAAAVPADDAAAAPAEVADAADAGGDADAADNAAAPAPEAATEAAAAATPAAEPAEEEARPAAAVGGEA